MSHSAAVSLPHFFLGIVFLLMGGIGITDVLGKPPEGRRALVVPVIVATGGLGMLAISLLDAWVWHAESLTYTAQLRAAVGAILFIAGVGQGWGRARGVWGLELPPQLAVLFAGVLSAMREQVAADEHALHVVVAGLVVVSTLANMSAVMSGESSRAMRLFGHLLLSAAALGLLLFEPTALAQSL